MNKEQLLEIIQDQVTKLDWTMEKAMPYLEKLGFTPEKVENNRLFGEYKVRLTVEFAYQAFKEEFPQEAGILA